MQNLDKQTSLHDVTLKWNKGADWRLHKNCPEFAGGHQSKIHFRRTMNKSGKASWPKHRFQSVDLRHTIVVKMGTPKDWIVDRCWYSTWLKLVPIQVNQLLVNHRRDYFPRPFTWQENVPPFTTEQQEKTTKTLSASLAHGVFSLVLPVFWKNPLVNVY